MDCPPFDLNKPQFSAYFYKPSAQQKQGEIIYLGPYAVVLAFAASQQNE